MKRQTKKLLYNLFFSKRSAFVVFLAVLVLGFSANVTLAKLSALAPGTPLPQEWKDAAQKIENLKNATTMPTSPFAYELYLKSIGGYSNDEAFKTASQYKSLLRPVAPGDKERLKEYETGNPSSTNIYESKVYNTANAPMEKILEVAEWGVLKVVIGVLSVIASFLKEFVSYAAELLDLTLNPSLYNFTSNRMIVQGWTMVRDVCNLFFLLILLFIAICTILKIEKYHAKKTLLTLIIMALLINFSKPITIFIFDGSQLLMNEFLKQMGGTQGTGQTTSTVVAKASQIAGNVYKTLPLNSGETAIAVQYLFGVVFLFMLMVAYLVTALMLIVRIVVIMMLIIVSPFAFFAAIIPDFSKMSSSWWSSLFEYSYYGPAAAFFLLLATNLDSALPPLQNISGTDGRIDVTVNNILQYLLVLVFLYASIFMAKKFGGGAGAAVVGNANRFMKWGAGMTKTGGVWGWGWRRSGLQGGLSQKAETSPWTSWLTKRGRRDAQQKREAWIAKKLGVKGAWFNAFQKRAEEENKGLDNNAVIEKAKAGNQYAALQALMNGDGDDLGVFNTLLGIVNKHPEMREHFRHLYRKSNQTQFAADIQAYNPNSGDVDKIRKQIAKDEGLSGTALEGRVREEIPKFYANKELGRLQKDGLAKVDFNDFTSNPNHVKEESHRRAFKEALLKRLDTFAEVNPSDLADLMSTSKGDNQNFILKNKDFRDILEKAKNAAWQQSSGTSTGSTASTPPPNVP